MGYSLGEDVDIFIYIKQQWNNEEENKKKTL